MTVAIFPSKYLYLFYVKIKHLARLAILLLNVIIHKMLVKCTKITCCAREHGVNVISILPSFLRMQLNNHYWLDYGYMNIVHIKYSI